MSNERQAREQIDRLRSDWDWVVQDYKTADFSAKRTDLDDFVACCNLKNRHADTGTDRCKTFTHDFSFRLQGPP